MTCGLPLRELLPSVTCDNICRKSTIVEEKRQLQQNSCFFEDKREFLTRISSVAMAAEEETT